MFLLASAKKNLSMCSFRLFGVDKPKEEEVWSTEVTDENIENAVEDEFGVKYSKDWKILLKAPRNLSGKYSIRKGVKVIGNRAFAFCNSLTIINIPNSVTTIGNSAFYCCRFLTSITIPSSVVTIIGNPFYLWHGNLYNESKAFIYEDHVLFNKNKTILIAYRAKETNYTISNSVTTIGEGAFCGCESLTNINIPNSVTTIGKGAFSHCDSLTSINIPNSVTTIGISAFWGCDSLTNINIPNSVTTIGKCAFSDCKSLTSINIPNSVTTIEDWTFHGCINLPSHIKSDIIQRFGEKVFNF